MEYNKLCWEILSGNVIGIWENNKFFLGFSFYFIMKYYYIIVNFVNFEKYIFENMFKISYYLSGYGVNFNEVFVSFIGESVERYIYFLLFIIIKDRIIFRLYEEMIKEYKIDLICEFKYINLYYFFEVCENYVILNDII